MQPVKKCIAQNYLFMKKKLLPGFTNRALALLLGLLAFTNTTIAQLVAVTGNYTGNGEDNHSIEGLGFKPDFVLINSNTYHAQIGSSTFPANSTKDMYGGELRSGRITSLDLDGFTLGDNNKVNKNGEEYNYLAFKKEAGTLEMGSYTGNNTDNRDIVCTDFKPDMVIIISADNNEKPVFSAITMGADETLNFLNSSFLSDRIQAFNPDGFQVGKNRAVNADGKKYHYLALRNDPGKINVGSYEGDGTPNRIINNLGYGSFVMVKRSGKSGLHRNRNMPFDKSYYFKNANSVSNRIKENTTNGFELGISDEVNESGKVYHYVQINGLSNILPVKLISFNARIYQRNVDLVWETAAERDIETIEVERSKNQLNFTKIAQVWGAGNRNDTVSYIYTDTDPLEGESYYRLKMISKNGNFEYSEIKDIFISENTKNQFSISPNPFRGNQLELHYTHKEDFLKIDIVNADGVKADQVILYNGNRQLHIKSNLPPGIYFVIGNNGKSILFRKKMVKLQY